MKTEIFIEGNRLDLTADLSSLLTLAIDDIKDFSSRQTSFSKTIVLPGTANNNKLFGHIFEVGQSNPHDETQLNFGYNFNASKSAGCLIFQDNIQTFKGVLKLMEIDIDRGKVEYSVAVFGDLYSLNTRLAGKLLENLDFSAYDHTLTAAAITGSWDASPGSGYYYPLIDHGNYSTDKHNWDYHTFRSAFYLAEYIDKIITGAQFRYESDLFASNRFKRMIIAHNQKIMTRLATSGTILIKGTGPSMTGSPVEKLKFSTITGSGFTYDSTHTIYTFAGSTAASVDIQLGINGLFNTSGSSNSITVKILKNGAVIFSQTATAFNYFSVGAYTSTSLNPGDTIEFRIPSYTSFTFQTGTQVEIQTAASSIAQIPINLNDPVPANEQIPKNIKQIDLLVSVVKLFNLYIVEDKFDQDLLYFIPYIDFFGVDTSAAIDWTYKLDRSKPINLKPMSEVNAKIYQYKYKADSDYYNDLYSKRYGMGYGSYDFYSKYEFAADTKAFELIFAPTPLVGYQGQDKIYSTIFKRSGSDDNPQEERVDSVIRLLQTKKVTGVDSWTIKDGASTISTLTAYGYAGHLDDPDAPSNDLNFGALEELFFILATGDLSKTQFNIYWSSYMAEITDKDSKLLTATFYLKPSDIFNLDFSKYITIDGVLFRLNKISDFNLSTPGTCRCELLKVNYTQY